MEGCRGDFQLIHRIGSREKLAAFRVSSEYRVFCIGEYIHTHLWSEPEIRNLRSEPTCDDNSQNCQSTLLEISSIVHHSCLINRKKVHQLPDTFKRIIMSLICFIIYKTLKKGYLQQRHCEGCAGEQHCGCE